MSARKVVVADDEPHIRHVLALKLQRGGLEVVMAGDGEEAFDLCMTERPDLLITDLQMPMMSGLDLCRKLRQEPATKNLPAMMLTARGFDLEDSEMADTGIVAVLSKPFSPAEVLQRAQDILAETAQAAREE